MSESIVRMLEEKEKVGGGECECVAGSMREWRLSKMSWLIAEGVVWTREVHVSVTCKGAGAGAIFCWSEGRRGRRYRTAMATREGQDVLSSGSDVSAR